jgi:hypothetical protein
MSGTSIAERVESLPHQRFANAFAARFGVNGEVLHEGPCPAQSCGRQPSLGVDDQKTQRRVEFGIA